MDTDDGYKGGTLRLYLKAQKIFQNTYGTVSRFQVVYTANQISQDVDSNNLEATQPKLSRTVEYSSGPPPKKKTS